MKQQVIFVCGPDMTGKTQIAQALAKQLKIPYFKATTERDAFVRMMEIHHTKMLTPYETDVERHFFLNQLLWADPRTQDLFEQGGFSMVFDRAYPCEKVYSQVFKRETNETWLEKLDDAWSRLGAKIIICRRSSYKGIKDDLDPRVDEIRLQQLDDAYLAFTQWTKCKTLVLNVDDENLKRELNDITNWLNLDV